MGSEKMTQEELTAALKDLPVGEIHCFDSIGSTNDFAFERSAAGAPDMSVITAFEQTKGRGRMQRRWITAPGASVPMTVIIRPKPSEMACLNLFSPLTGLAVMEALNRVYGIGCQIKWPNDVLLNRRKISGILCETQWEGDQLRALILGLGTNLLSGAAPAIPDLTYPASSVEDETGIVISRTEWIRGFLEQLIRLRPLIGTEPFFGLWERSLAYKDEQVLIVRPDESAEVCIVRGVDREGNLIAEDGNGKLQSYIAGEISVRPMAPKS